MYQQAPQLVDYMVLEKAKIAAEKNISEYNTLFWLSPEFKSLDIKEKEKKIERKHYLEESFITLERVLQRFKVNITFPEVKEDPKVGYKLNL